MDNNANSVNEKYSQDGYYVLNSDHHGVVRLALQHMIWRKTLGFNVHPSIPALPADAKVADIATGTGLWLLEVAEELGPEATLHGFDVSLVQAPPKAWLPKNVEFFEWNLFEEPPSQFQGKYDLVHVRLITVVLKSDDPAVVVRNFCKLLKPGGWLQWDEVEVYDAFVAKASPELQVPSMDQWCQWMAGSKQEYQGNDPASLWKSRLAEILHSNGFERAQRHDHLEDFMKDMPLMRCNSDQIMMLSEQYARRVFATNNEMGPKLLNIVQGAAKDAQKGSCMVVPPLSWVAQKK